MLRHALILGVLPLAFGCAAARTSEVVHSEVASPRTAVALEPAAEAPLASPTTLAPATSAPLSPAAASAVALNDQSTSSTWTTIKGGYWGADEDALDDGFVFNLAWMRFLNRLFALELELGYLDADGEDEGVDAEVWALPLMLNGRFNIPVWVLDLYAGAGIGGFYYDVEVSDGGNSADDDGFLFGGNGFAGASISLADRIALGLEAKYYISEDIDDADAGLDAFALMLTLGFGK